MVHQGSAGGDGPGVNVKIEGDVQAAPHGWVIAGQLVVDAAQAQGRQRREDKKDQVVAWRDHVAGGKDRPFAVHPRVWGWRHCHTSNYSTTILNSLNFPACIPTR
ncbi:MAG: hypothetical protein VCE75_00365, partial [Alphaproteobacteria bacterium]